MKWRFDGVDNDNDVVNDKGGQQKENKKYVHLKNNDNGQMNQFETYQYKCYPLGCQFEDHFHTNTENILVNSYKIVHSPHY